MIKNLNVDFEPAREVPSLLKKMKILEHILINTYLGHENKQLMLIFVGLVHLHRLLLAGLQVQEGIDRDCSNPKLLPGNSKEKPEAWGGGAHVSLGVKH